MKNILFFPFLFSIFPILLLYSENIDEIQINDVVFPLSATLLSSLGLFFVLKFSLKNSVKSGLIVTLLFSIFFSYGYIFEILGDSILFELDLVHQRYILPIFMILTISGLVLIIKIKKDLETFRSILNVISVVMILFISINIIIFFAAYENQNEISQFQIEEKIIQENNFPDIYHIILDEYTNSQVLLEDFDFDNSAFIQYLKNSNFTVIDNALSNYPATEPFLSSSLNLNYLDDSHLEKYNRLAIEERISNNFVMKFLKQNGYKIIVPYSGYGSPDRFLASDKIICSETIFLKNKFFTELSRTTILNYFVEKQIENERRFIQECAFSELSTITDKFEEPVYVFTHLFIPHAPYLFDKDGNYVTPKNNKLKGLLGHNNPDGYLNELQFANKQMKHIVSQIIKKSNNSIIIIQGDTGSSILNNPSVEDFKKKRLSILYAIYVPNDYSVPENLSSVNTYRFIFKNFFDSDYEILENKYFWYSEFEEISSKTQERFTDITKIINNSK